MPTLWTKLRPLLINLVAALALLALGLTMLDEFEPPQTPTASDMGKLTIGRQSNFPYQFEEGDLNGLHRPSGLDTELLREAFRRAGYDIEFEPEVWNDALTDVERGRLDAVSLAFKTAERERFAYFSVPFFSLRTALFYKRGALEATPSTASELFAQVQHENLTLEYTRGTAFVPQIATGLESVGALAEAADTDAASLEDLMEGNVDVVLADQLAGTSLVLKNGWNRDITCVVLDIPAQDAHLMFSRKSVSPETVTAFNEAMSSMEKDGTKAEIVRAYYYPTVLSLLAHAFRFDVIGVLAAAAAAVSGLFLARKARTNLVGAFLLAAAPAAGGGLLRDLIAGRRPVGIVASPTVLLTVLFLTLVAFLVFRSIDKKGGRASLALDTIEIDEHPVLVFFDALGLSAFTVFGVLIAMQWRCEPLWLWGPILAAMTNAGGSFLRDLILQRPVGLVRSLKPYVEVSIFWGWLLSLYLTYSSSHLPYHVLDLQVAVMVTLLGVALTYSLTRLSRVEFPALGVPRDT